MRSTSLPDWGELGTPAIGSIFSRAANTVSTTDGVDGADFCFGKHLSL
jgi:hypothetical protein